MKEIHTNIIAGIYKNKKILLPPIHITRASKKILRESFFNTIAFDIIDNIFIEVFAGSGSMGIEAISRGAKEVLFFEKNDEAFNVLKRNIKNLDIKNSRCFLGDSFLTLRDNIKYINEQKVYFYFDPPFSIRDGNEDIYNKTIELIKSLDKNIVKMICIEHISNIKFDENIGSFAKIKEKKFGKSKLSYFGEHI